MNIKTKTIEATIEDVEGSSGPGEFTVALATPDLDREGDELHGDEWELPLPGHITFVNDHTHKVNSIVGSATPTLEGDTVVCRGTYATTENAQDTRKLVKGKHLTHVSVAYREKSGPNGPVRELINGSFVVVPANTHAMVLASKGIATDEGELTDDAKTYIKSIVEEALSMKSVATQELPPTGENHLAPEEAPSADPAADQEKEAKTLAALRAKAFGFASNHETD